MYSAAAMTPAIITPHVELFTVASPEGALLDDALLDDILSGDSVYFAVGVAAGVDGMVAIVGMTLVATALVAAIMFCICFFGKASIKLPSNPK